MQYQGGLGTSLLCPQTETLTTGAQEGPGLLSERICLAGQEIGNGHQQYTDSLAVRCFLCSYAFPLNVYSWAGETPGQLQMLSDHV
jgi:hypothetical protein